MTKALQKRFEKGAACEAEFLKEGIHSCRMLFYSGMTKKDEAKALLDTLTKMYIAATVCLGS